MTGGPGTLEAFFVRHGQSTANARGVWQGRLEFPLSELGRRQASRAGAALAATGGFSSVYSSPLARAAETAEIIAAELKAAGSFAGGVIELPGLTERHGGVLQGRPYEQSREEKPKLIEKFDSLPGDEAWSLVEAETDEQLRERFSGALAEISSPATDAGARRVAIVAHGGVLKAFLRGEFGDAAALQGVRLPNASLTRIIWRRTGKGAELLDLASTRHLADLEG